MEVTVNDMTQVLEIKPGQLWAMPKEGPWGGHHIPVTILDVRDGWVRYGYGPDDDNRRPEASFRAAFIPLPPALEDA